MLIVWARLLVYSVSVKIISFFVVPSSIGLILELKIVSLNVETNTFSIAVEIFLELLEPRVWFSVFLHGAWF